MGKDVKRELSWPKFKILPQYLPEKELRNTTENLSG
jgi:hypothetical protein